MAPNQQSENQEILDPQTDCSVTRRDLARKVAYVAPAVLAVIAAANRPLIAASGTGGPQ
jgi:hypothetical protein